MNLKVGCTYHNVGQGLFFSGKLELNDNEEFNFVYDCGSESPGVRHLEKVIDDYVHTLPRKNSNKKKLDLLVISHFHNDHINGLDYLLKKVNIKTVILPYLSPLELLLYIAVNIKPPYPPVSYFNFLLNPIQYLVEKGVERIIVIGRGSEGDEYIEDDFNPPDNPTDFNPQNPFNIDELGLPEGNKIVENELRKDGLGDLIDKEIIPKSHHGFASLLGICLFRFFNVRNSIDDFNKKIKNFEKCLLSSFNVSSIEKILKNKYILNELKERRNNKFRNCYRRVFGKNNINLTSIILYNQLLIKSDDIKILI